MGQHSETVSVGRKGTSVISFQCCRLQCPAPFTTENTALLPYPGLPLLFPVQLVPSTLLLAFLSQIRIALDSSVLEC